MTTITRAACLRAALVLLGVSGCEGTITNPGNGEDAPDAGGAAEVGATGPGGAVGNPGAPDPRAPMVTLTPGESDADLLNPERGYFVGVRLFRPADAARARDGGHTLALVRVRLDDYRDAPIADAFLAELDATFAAARAAGIKLVVRFRYNGSATADAPKHIMLGHIAQLEPVLRANEDVIAVLQAGFIGAWGEWHGSTNGLDNDADRAEILSALLAALPSSRGVQVRTPMYKDAILPGGPVTAAEAFGESARARVGHHNDCFLASNSDYGTYTAPVAAWKEYVAADTRFTSMGGETCAVYEPRTNCAAAVAEMEALHWSYLNREYNRKVLDAWEAEGCAGEVEQRLGYRFVVSRVAYTEAVRPGGVLDLEIDIANRGFAAPLNRRPVYVVLSDGSTHRRARLSGVDARRWGAGETARLATSLRVPAELAPGTYTLSLWLPDEAAALEADPRYAIQLANEGVWSEAEGHNVLTRALHLDVAAPGGGDVDPLASDFAELP
jgi:hypothetical protein